MQFSDNYEWLSGWIHDYYCDIDGSELIFDINNSKIFECPICHKKYSDSKRKRAWVTKYRYNIFNKIEKYSELYLQDNNKEYLNYIIDAFEYYSKFYDKFPIHNKDGKIYEHYINESNRCGKITAQGLNEATMAIQFVNCIDNLEKFIPKEIQEKLFNNLFTNIFELLKPQVNKIHNISCYGVCAIGMMGIISNNCEMIDFALNSKYSFYKQLELGTTKDGFWYEGSFHYHLYVLKPILQFLSLAKKYKYHILNNAYEIARRMLILPFICSFSDCTLPSPNDGWPNKSINDYIIDYKLGNCIFDGELDDIISLINERKNNNKTVHLIDTGFSMLKNKKWNVFIKYKDNNINHAHPDKLNIEVKINKKFLTYDLSTSGYGSELSKNYYKKSYSHNTIVINNEDQSKECDTFVNLYDDDSIKVKIKNLYDNIEISRKISLTNNTMNDQVLVEKNNKIVDYIFHCDAKLISKYKSKKIDCLKEYPYFTNVEKVISEDFIILEWILENEILYSKINLENKTLFICNSPDNPDIKKRTTLIIRSSNNNILFNIKWEVI